MARKIPVDFFFDLMSPFSRIGMESLLRYESIWPISVRLRPFMLGLVFKETGNSTPALQSPAKAAYLKKDVLRSSRHFNVAMNWPDDFSKRIISHSTAYANRVILAVEKMQPEKLNAVTRGFFERFWITNGGVHTEEDLREVLSSCGVADVEGVLRLSREDGTKQLLVSNTKEAVSLGAFGAPWTVVSLGKGRKECFFGSDRLHLVAKAIGEKYRGPVAKL